ncbi:sulfurtransferase TusA family protein [Sulfurihydrogenibium azorense]|uniref:sulfurtransferase TusA family protein n=1 Tax=Sulfurihydrogenibium azorense TaxID=309806 RepID=UPI002409B2F4|nr:sulfurtransferase TusA family protein [Sulfurihydrogenibium azorense]MDM7274221.1 sulfurtransferase TusA family protein [Sulfurihydrogenibium azorense]
MENLSANNNIPIIDTRGLFCPLPLTLVSRKLKEIPVGGRLKVLADDKAFKKDIEVWAYETGNKLAEFKEENGYFVVIIERGKGFKGESIIDKIKFISLGVKLHFIKHFLDIVPFNKPKYLLTFVSVAEGIRANNFLKEKNINNYIMLPVPKEIYPHCGLVFGFKNKEDALNIYNLLKENKFAVEDVHVIDKEKKYPKIT